MNSAADKQASLLFRLVIDVMSDVTVLTELEKILRFFIKEFLLKLTC